jgi:chromosome segregation ATPase
VPIEQAMYVTLGFLLAGLVVLLFLPALWARASRLSMRRLQMLAPFTREEAIAQRDLLRADHAFRERRIAQELDEAKASKAKHLLEIGRKTVQLHEQEEKFKRAEAHARELQRQLDEARGQLEERGELLAMTESALHAATARYERVLDGLRAEKLDPQKFGAAARAELSPPEDALKSKLAELHEQSGALRRAVEALQRENASLSPKAQSFDAAAADLARLLPEFESVQARKQERENELDALRVASREDGDRQAGRIAHLELALRQSRDEARDFAEKLETARADNSMLQGAINALRKDRERMRGSALPAISLDAGDVAALRQEIVNLGAKMLNSKEHAD